MSIHEKTKTTKKQATHTILIKNLDVVCTQEVDENVTKLECGLSCSYTCMALYFFFNVQ
jgi:hypothetical protein